MGAIDIDCLVESLLFIAEGPVTAEDLAKALQADVEVVEQAVQRLTAMLQQRGVRIVRVGRRVQMVSAPEAAPVIEAFLGLDGPSKLSPAALETLAIIAYRQPITRAQIDAIRGVNSEGVLRTLLAKSLIAPVGRLEQAGRPVVYATTFEFLQYFGIQSLEELPTLPELENLAEARGSAEYSEGS